MTTDAYFQARSIALNLLAPNPTTSEVESAVNDAAELVRIRSGDVDRSALIRELEAQLNVFQPEGVSLADDSGHIEWFGVRRGEIQWKFWGRYLRYMREREGLPPLVLERLDSSTARILSRLEDPSRTGSWDRRGMVVGQVQSGKTSNYTGLICKAADSGYKLIVVLAGSHNSLRSQTQLRLDAGFLGFDTQRRQMSVTDDGFAAATLGVGRLVGEERLAAASLTNSSENGDFGVQKARQFGVALGSYPVLLVVKKHVGILRNLRSWLLDGLGTGEPKRAREFPILLIDDEADNASINTRDLSNDPDLDPTSINRAIRALLHSFDKKSYVGYTATPYANIYVDPEADHPEYGPDLFPRNFIEYLRPPSNYFGPARLFGLAPDSEPLPLYREVEDSAAWIPDRHRNGHVPGPLPNSVKMAIRTFVLVCAARIARGERNRHNSMLIHVTRFTSVQALVARQVEDELEELRSRIKFGAGTNLDVSTELKRLWESDFITTSLSMGETLPDWETIEPHLLESISPITVRTVNGDAKDALEYFEHRETGLNVIAIGGDKLSRGLTLEGLSVSFYLRASRAFDTLLQMGRWFGYRPRYEDLCRLFSTATLFRAYREVSVANEELISEFEMMALLNRTPRDYGLKVADSVDGMLVTAANKMRAAMHLRVGFAGGISETVALPCDTTRADFNYFVTQEFLNSVLESHGEPYLIRGNWAWSGVPGSSVASDFFGKFVTPESAWRVNSQTIGRYINDRLSHGELTEWTVVLISTSPQDKLLIPGVPIGFTSRRLGVEPSHAVARGTYSIKRLVSPSDETLDFSDLEIREMLNETVREYELDPGRRSKMPDVPSGAIIRKSRPVTRGLLLLYPIDPPKEELRAAAREANFKIAEVPLIGFAASFPASDDAPAMDYVVNRQFLVELLGGAEGDERDEEGEL